jgi:hypothetical protein
VVGAPGAFYQGYCTGIVYPEWKSPHMVPYYGFGGTGIAQGTLVLGGVGAGYGLDYDFSEPDGCGENGICSNEDPPPTSSGCMDPVACNYDSLATGISVNCCYVAGCTDPLALNYELGACCDDGSCCYGSGCTNPVACNYDESVCADDGSCCYVSGCRDVMALNYNNEACCDDNSACCYVAGCTDPLATNYDPNACIDDGSCESCTSSEVNSCEAKGQTNMNEFWTNLEIGLYYPIVQPYMTHLNWFINSTNYQVPFASKFFELDITTGGSSCERACEGPNGGDYVAINSYKCEFVHENGSTGSQVVYSWNDAITFWNNAKGVSGWLNSTMDWLTVQSKLTTEFITTQPGQPNRWSIEIHDEECCECTSSSTCGCTDPLAKNYDPNATFDDGSCTYCNSGCTDDACGNYDANYTCDCNDHDITDAAYVPASGWDSCCNCVSIEESWDCEGGSCYDPGTGLGQYTTLTACQAVCGVVTPSPSWDCDSTIFGSAYTTSWYTGTACVDPGTGSGQYSTLAACEEQCCDYCNTLFVGLGTLSPNNATNSLCDNGTIAQQETTFGSSVWTLQIYDTGVLGQSHGGTLVHQEDNIASGAMSSTVTLPQGEYNMVRIDSADPPCPASECKGSGRGTAFSIGCTP